MYLEFFKFSCKPFSITPDPDIFYLTASARETCDSITEAIHRREPCLLLSGEPGTGKTTILKRLMAEDDSGIRWILLNKTQLSWDELLVFIGQELELSSENYDSDLFPEKVSRKLSRCKRRGLHPVLIVDEADLLKNNTLQQLLQWHTSNQVRKIPLTIIFAGLKKLTHTFANVSQGILLPRPAVLCDLKRFDLQETRAVISYRLKLADYSGPELFEDEALKLIQKLSGGIPRVINLICELGLVLAASLKERRISAQIVQEASEYILLDKFPGMESNPPEEQSVAAPASANSATGDKDPAAERPVIAAKSPKPARPHERQPLKWGWAAAGLLIMLTGGGTWLWMQYRLVVDSPENSQRLVFKVPLDDPVGNKKISADPQTIPHDIKNFAAGSKTLTDIPEEKEAGALLSQAQDIFPTQDQIPGEGSPAEKIVENPSEQKAVSAIPKLQKPETTSLTTSAQKPEENLRAVDLPKGAELITAVEKGDQKAVSRLLDAGAKINSTNTTGETALMKAAWAGRGDIVKLLLNHGPRINKQSLEGWTALFYSAVKGHKDVVSTLLAQGAKPDLADQDGRTPLMAAAWNGHADIVELLLKNSANPNLKNRDGWTPLMFAALEGHIDVAELLLRGGANPAIKNNEGDTSAKLATHQGHTRVSSLLSTQAGP